MNDDMAATSIGGGDTAWLTTTNLVLIAIGIVLAIVVIIYGARLKRQRRAVDEAIEDRADNAGQTPAPPAAPLDRTLDDGPPPAPEIDSAPEPVTAPPVAPAPPPLAGDDTPVVATAPFDAAPATIAADLATTSTNADTDTDPAPARKDNDLTRMKGVGPKLAARLAELGITRFAQIATLSPTDAAALDAQLGNFQGRMARDRWVEQAGYLAVDDKAGFEAAFGKL